MGLTDAERYPNKRVCEDCPDLICESGTRPYCYRGIRDVYDCHKIGYFGDEDGKN